MLREGNELRHRAQRLIQAVELIAAAAGSGRQTGITVQCAVDSPVIGEIHDDLRVVVDLDECQAVLIRMNVRDRTEIRRTAINMGQVQECGIGRRSGRDIRTAGRERIRDHAFVEIDCAGIEIGRSCSIGYGREFKIVGSLGSSAAAKSVAAGGDACP